MQSVRVHEPRSDVGRRPPACLRLGGQRFGARQTVPQRAGLDLESRHFEPRLELIGTWRSRLLQREPCSLRARFHRGEVAGDPNRIPGDLGSRSHGLDLVGERAATLVEAPHGRLIQHRLEGAFDGRGGAG